LAALAEVGAKPVGVGIADAVGFRDDTRRVYGFGPLSGDEQVRAALDLLRGLYGAPVEAADAAAGRYLSDTGELVRDVANGRLIVNTPTVAAVAGQLGGGTYRLGGLRIETGTQQGVALLLSLDGKRLAESGQMLARFVTDASNTDMLVTPPGPDANPRNLYAVAGDGTSPVSTGGRSVAKGWRVYRGEQLWFAVGLAGGTAEVVLDGGGWRWFVDTPGVWVRVAGAANATMVLPDGTARELGSGEAWQYPAVAAMVTAR
jgi:hypothetical protein